MTRRLTERKRLLVGVGAALVLGAVASLVLVQVTSASESPPIGDGSVSALDRARVSADALPGSLPADVPDRFAFTSLDAARRVYADDKRTIWLVPGKPDSICFVEEMNGIGVDCTTRSLLRTSAIYATSIALDGTASITGVVDDAVTAVDVLGGATIPVHNNVFVLDGVKGDSVTLTLQTATVSGRLVIDHLQPDDLLRGHQSR